MSSNVFCVDCKYHRETEKNPGFMCQPGHICDHPKYLSPITKLGLYSCFSMRQDTGIFSREKYCGPDGKLFVHKNGTTVLV